MKEKILVRPLFIFLFCLCFNASWGQVVINELGIAPACGSCNAAGGGEYIELFNKGCNSVDISCYTIIWTGLSGGGNPTGWTITIPPNTHLASCAYYLIGGSGKPAAGWANSAIGGNSWNNVGSVDLDISTTYNTSLQTCAPGNLVDTEGQIDLLDATGTSVSAVSYNSSGYAANFPASSNSVGPCGGLNTINTLAAAAQNVIGTWHAGSNSQTIELDVTGTYIATSNQSPGSANTTNGQIACSSGPPTASNAGPAQNVCGTTATLAGNTPVSGTGTWTLVSGAGTITTPAAHNSGITGLGVGANVFQWTISKAGCTSSSSTVTITGVASPSVANAGGSGSVCGTSTTLAGNSPTTGTGLWTLVSGAGTITTPTANNSGVTALGVGANVFQWTISNAPCTASSAQVTLTGVTAPSASVAGSAQNICGTTATLAGNSPVTGTGLWTLVSGSGTITTPSANNSGVTGLGVGANVFQWTISNAPCAPTSSQVTITGVASPTVASAGGPQSVCGTSATLAGTPVVTGTGLWTLISGSGTITTPTADNSGVTALGVGANVFQWTISNAPCAASSAQVTITGITAPTVANAGGSFSACGTTATLAGNIAVSGTGLWTLVSGTGTITTPGANNSGLTGLGVGPNVFQWTISNPPCTASSSQVTVTGVASPTASNAGAAQNICGTTATLNGNVPVDGTGVWSLVSGSGTITTPTANNSGVTGLGLGANVFEWTISNNPCAPSSSTVTITGISAPSASNAGAPQSVCGTIATLNGNTPVSGTGVWTLISGSGVITTPTAVNSGVTGLGLGANVFQWTISNPPCAPSSSQVTITSVASPSVSNAGGSFNVCGTNATLNGNIPVTGTGLWSLVSGAGTITTPAANNSGVTGLGVGPNVFQWTISNAPCTASSAQVTITSVASPTASNAGVSANVCGSTATLSGNVPVDGTGLWTLVSGTATITTPTANNSGVTGLGLGPNVFQWTISNNPCAPSASQVTFTGVTSPTVSNAGGPQSVCGTSATLAGNAAVTGSGLWTLVSGSGTITSPTSPTSGVTGLGVGANVFQWTISNNPCTPSSSQVTITGVASPTVSNAGGAASVCGTSTTLNGNTAVTGTGLWTLISGSGTITTPSSEISGVTGLGLGPNVFQWTISNPPCAPSSSQVTITGVGSPTVSNAGAPQSVCGNAATLAGNAALTGTGLWTLVSGSGTITTPTANNSGVTGLGAGANIFEWTISNNPCAPSATQVTITSVLPPTVSNAGVSGSVCGTNATLAGNTALSGTGLWTLVSGSGTITTPNAENSGVTGLGAGPNVFQWTISNPPCASSSSQVTITGVPSPTVSSAGAPQSVCGTTATLAGNNAVSGTGLWTLVSGTSSITTPTADNSGLTGLGVGPNVFQWTISNAPCAASTSQVTITGTASPTVANAGAPQAVCGTTATLAGNTPVTGTGLWTLISGAGTITTPASPNSGVTGLGAGANVFQWTISNNPCVASSSQVTISSSTGLALVPSQTNILCNGASTGSATAAVSGGTGAGTYVYAWTPSGGAAATASGLAANTYTCSIKDGNNCPLSQTFVITQPAIITLTPSNTPSGCGVSTGSATVVASGGTGAGTYTYSWTPLGGTAATAPNIASGTYTISVTDANNCPMSTTTIVGNTSGPSASLFSSANISCHAACNGTATVSISGGTGAGTYTYSWNPSGGTSATATALCPNTYTCNVRDANNCLITQTVTITEPSALALTPSQTNVLCSGSPTGTATAAMSGGTGAYTYSWTPSGGTAATASGLVPNTYTCSVTDANNCPISQTFSIISPSALAITPSQTNILCNGSSTGSATASVSGGTGAYVYVWTPSGGAGATASGLTANTYTCSVKDGNNCPVSQTFILTEPGALAITPSQTNILCNAASTGSATAAVTGGTGAGTYAYSWTPSGGTAATASGLTANTYTCSIMDGNNCPASQTFIISQPNVIALTPSATLSGCGVATGSASVAVTGGTGAGTYAYTWTPSGGTLATESNIASGTYTVAVTDGNNCQMSTTIFVGNSSGPSSSSVFSNVTCHAACNGTATANATGGTGPGTYTYSWTPSGGTLATATALCPNTYTCNITDANNCLTVQTVTIAEPAILSITPTQTNNLCNGSSTASATATVNGGTGTYTYSWTPSGGSLPTASGLASNTYTCSVTDGNNCPVSQTFLITAPAALSVTVPSQTNVLCHSGTTGAATANATGGTGAATYTYSWSPSGGNAVAATNLSAGTYTCNVTDANGCPSSATVTLSQPLFALNDSVHSTPAACGGNNGTATVFPYGGTASYTYSWSPAGGTNAIASGIPTGAYTCTITDGNGCQTTANITVNPVPALTAAASTTAVKCNGDSTGSVSVTPSGGTSAYTYSWSPMGGIGSIANGLKAGTYTCTVTDAKGCTFISTATLTQPASPLSESLAATNISCNGLGNGSATATPSGGTAGYSYSWTPSGGTSATALNLAIGTYTCQVTDLNGCTAQSTTNITQPVVLSATQSTTNATCGANSGTATVNPAGGTGTYTYSWTPSGGTAATATSLLSGSYTCLITDANGCSQSTIALVGTTGSLPALSVAASGPSSFCQGKTDTLTASGGTTYSWSTGATSPSIVVTATGSYTVTATNSCGSTSLTYNTVVSPLPVAVITGNANACKGDSVKLTASGGTTYLWSNGVTGPVMYASASGTYWVKDSNACGSNTAQTVVTISTITALFTADSTSGNAALTVNFTNSSSPSATTWSWNFGDGNTSTSPNPANTFTASGVYNVLLTTTDSHGCPATYSMPITVTDVTPWILVPNVFTPNGDGQNDLFIITAQGLSEFNVKIYDRWGVALAELISQNQGWDGRTEAGSPCVNGTYYYILEAKAMDKKIIKQQGFFMLIH
jgi:gliding motility-associated-like protein